MKIKLKSLITKRVLRQLENQTINKKRNRISEKYNLIKEQVNRICEVYNDDIIVSTSMVIDPEGKIHSNLYKHGLVLQQLPKYNEKIKKMLNHDDAELMYDADAGSEKLFSAMAKLGFIRCGITNKSLWCSFSRDASSKSLMMVLAIMKKGNMNTVKAEKIEVLPDLTYTTKNFTEYTVDEFIDKFL